MASGLGDSTFGKGSRGLFDVYPNAPRSGRSPKTESKRPEAVIYKEPVSPKILLIRLSSLGDLVLATAAVAPLAAAGASVSLVTKSEFAPLFRGQPGIREVFAFDKKKGEREAREELFAWARTQGFTLILDLQNSWRTWSWRPGLRRIAPVGALGKPRLREWLVLFLRQRSVAGFGGGGRARRFRDLSLIHI